MTTSSPNRIVSLAPSATATLSALGVTDAVVGVTAHCEHDAPAVGGWLSPDVDAVADLDPDLIFTADELQADVATELTDREYDVHHSTPATLPDVIGSFEAIGAAAGASDAGRTLADEASARLDRIEERVGGRDRPVVYCEEWSDPPMVAGNWVPDAVAAAGGRYPFVDGGDRSREVDRAEVEAVAPDHAFVHVCGFGERADPSVVRDRGWDMPAVERDAVHVVDDALLNRPGPGLLDGVERLARTLHPDAFEP